MQVGSRVFSRPELALAVEVEGCFFCPYDEVHTKQRVECKSTLIGCFSNLHRGRTVAVLREAVMKCVLIYDFAEPNTRLPSARETFSLFVIRAFNHFN